MEVESVTKFISNLYNMSIVFSTLLFLEFLTVLRSLTGFGAKPADSRHVTAAEYLRLIDDKNPQGIFAAAGVEPSGCRVCLSEFEDGERIRRLQCDHVFHRDCLDTWLQDYCATCPLCRGKVLPDDVVAGRRRMGNQPELEESEEDLIIFLSALHGGRLYF